jgi:hypothetical protein
MTFRVGILVAVIVGLGCSSKEETPPCMGAACGPVDAGAMDAPSVDAFVPMDGGTDAGLADAGRMRPDGAAGESRFYAVNVLDLGAPVPGGDETIVPGFDLDGMISDRSDPETCRHADRTSPPPDMEMGVDNELGPLLASQEMMFMVRANMRNSLAEGRLIVLLEVSDVHDWDNDPWVVVDVMFGLLPVGSLAPMLDAMGRVAPGQTFDVDVRSLEADMVTPAIRLDGAEIIGGRLRTGVGDFGIGIPYDMDTNIMLDIKRARLRADVTETRMTRGVIGGALQVEPTVAAIVAADPKRFDEGLIRLVLESAADLDRDAAGECTSVSIGMVFDAVEAVRGVVRSPTAP